MPESFPSLLRLAIARMRVSRAQLGVNVVILSFLATVFFVITYASAHTQVLLLIDMMRTFQPQDTFVLNTDFDIAMVQVGLKVLGMFTVLSFLLFFAMTQFFVLACSTQPMSNGALWKKSFGMFLPLLGVQVWSYLRTFAWIPYLGVIPYIYFAPRFTFAPVLLMDGTAHIAASVRMSTRLSTGRWWLIVWFLFLLSLCSLPFILLGIIGIAVAVMVLPVAFFLTAASAFLFTAFYAFFLSTWTHAISQQMPIASPDGGIIPALRPM